MMKKLIFTSVLSMLALTNAWGVTSTLSASEAAAAMDLAKSSGCLSCHALDEKVVGPAYVKVAAKYKGVADAPDSLAQSVRIGSSGKWGRMAMPAHNTMSDQDIKTLIRWVLSLQP
jgi:cytochrome c